MSNENKVVLLMTDQYQNAERELFLDGKVNEIKGVYDAKEKLKGDRKLWPNEFVHFQEQKHPHGKYIEIRPAYKSHAVLRMYGLSTTFNGLQCYILGHVQRHKGGSDSNNTWFKYNKIAYDPAAPMFYSIVSVAPSEGMAVDFEPSENTSAKPAPASSSEPAPAAAEKDPFEGVADDQLMAIGIAEEMCETVRKARSNDDVEKLFSELHCITEASSFALMAMLESGYEAALSWYKECDADAQKRLSEIVKKAVDPNSFLVDGGEELDRLFTASWTRGGVFWTRVKRRWRKGIIKALTA